MSIEERGANANTRIEIAGQKRGERKAQEGEDSLHHRTVGELVTRYFSGIRKYQLGTDEKDRIWLEAFLFELSTDPDLVDDLKTRADRLVSENPEGGWREPD